MDDVREAGESASEVGPRSAIVPAALRGRRPERHCRMARCCPSMCSTRAGRSFPARSLDGPFMRKARDCNSCPATERESRGSDVQLARPVKTRRHIGQAISLRGLRSDVQRADGVNAKIAVFLTNIVGSMWCAYVFGFIPLIRMSAAL